MQGNFPQDNTGAAADLNGLAVLLRMALSGEDLAPLGERLLARAQATSDAAAMMDAATILQLKGNPEIALSVQQIALQRRRHFRIPARRSPPALRVLALMAPGDLMANVPLECLLEDSDVELHFYYVTPGQPLAGAVPEHDVVFVALSESEANHPILDQLRAELSRWPRPVLNRPEFVQRVARDRVCAILGDKPGIRIPPTARVTRDALADVASGNTNLNTLTPAGDFPIIIRPLDSHAGHDLQRLDGPAELGAYLAAVAHGDFFISPFVDYRGEDGQFRKYRLALIAGQPFACHMAISSHWMIHYMNAGMADNAAKRAEEARFMATFDEDFARRHANALRAIFDGMGLDYVCVDCAETRDGRLLIFEVDHAMVVHALDPVDVFPYKQPQMQKVFRAFRELLGRAAGRGEPTKRAVAGGP